MRWCDRSLPSPRESLFGVVIGLTLLVAHIAWAESTETSSVAPRVGDHVRITLDSGDLPVTGRLLAWDARSLGLLLDDEAVGEDGVEARRLSRASIVSLEVGVKHSHPVQGAVIGALLVATAGIVTLAVADRDSEEALGGAGLLFAAPLVGGGIGAIVGGGIEHETWKPAPLPQGEAKDR